VTLADISILRTSSPFDYRCPLDWLPTSRLLPPRSGLERSDLVLCHKADLPFAHGDVRLIALTRSWLIAQKLARFQRAALPLVGAGSGELRLIIVGQ